MSKGLAVASFFISLLSLSIAVLCAVDLKDDVTCTVSYDFNHPDRR